ncbi:hypothetical protein GCM10009779_08790 [Polymorphospora rubra]|uniref:Uncharacterized protein n=1 Tax=Polymorphospora rubra TaxID=338584 RepID=A0A810N792_9ACTN|nr:hypothetical protein Prubr_66820 [Polymorphospora rubra]
MWDVAPAVPPSGSLGAGRIGAGPVRQGQMIPFRRPADVVMQVSLPIARCGRALSFHLTVDGGSYGSVDGRPVRGAGPREAWPPPRKGAVTPSWTR